MKKYYIKNKINDYYACDDGTESWDINDAEVFTTTEAAQEIIQSFDEPNFYQVSAN